MAQQRNILPTCDCEEICDIQTYFKVHVYGIENWAREDEIIRYLERYPRKLQEWLNGEYYARQRREERNRKLAMGLIAVKPPPMKKYGPKALCKFDGECMYTKCRFVHTTERKNQGYNKRICKCQKNGLCREEDCFLHHDNIQKHPIESRLKDKMSTLSSKALNDRFVEKYPDF